MKKLGSSSVVGGQNTAESDQCKTQYNRTTFSNVCSFLHSIRHNLILHNTVNNERSAALSWAAHASAAGSVRLAHLRQGSQFGEGRQLAHSSTHRIMNNRTPMRIRECGSVALINRFFGGIHFLMKILMFFMYTRLPIYSK